MTTAPPPRRPSGVREVIRYNWPLYAAGVLTAAGGWAAARHLPRPAAALARAGAVTATAHLAVSTLATRRVYDRSGLYTYDWMPALLPDGPGTHLVVSAGLDEVSHPISAKAAPGGRIAEERPRCPGTP